jgi:transposase
LLDKWYFRASHSRIPQMIEAAKTIKLHRDWIVNWKRTQINNGILEGLNSVVQSAKARARWFRTTKYFIIIAYLVTAKLDFSKINPFCPPT